MYSMCDSSEMEAKNKHTYRLQRYEHLLTCWCLHKFRPNKIAEYCLPD